MSEFSIEPFMATFNKKIICTGKTLAEVKEKLRSVESGAGYPSYSIFEVNSREVFHGCIPKDK